MTDSVFSFDILSSNEEKIKKSSKKSFFFWLNWDLKQVYGPSVFSFASITNKYKRSKITLIGKIFP